MDEGDVPRPGRPSTSGTAGGSRSSTRRASCPPRGWSTAPSTSAGPSRGPARSTTCASRSCPARRSPASRRSFGAAFLYENEMRELFGVNVTGIALDLEGPALQTSRSVPFAPSAIRGPPGRPRKRRRTRASTKSAEARHEAHRHPLRAPAPGPARADRARPGPRGREGRRRDPHHRLHPPRPRSARREARVHRVRLRRRAHLRHLQLHARHGLLRGGRDDHGRRGAGARPLAAPIWGELSRVHSHLLWLGLAADAFGFENLFMHCWRTREEVLDIFEKTTGGRIIFSVNRIGGVRRDISDSELAAIVEKLQRLGAELCRDGAHLRDRSVHPPPPVRRRGS